MTPKRSTEFFIAGGTLRPDAPSYIERRADQELYEATLRGDFCYVLTSRQMGKSSLMARTAKRLRMEGINTAIIDLTQIGGEQTTTIIGEWYYGILHQILRSLGIKENLQAWWNERKHVSPVQRLTECFHDLILQQTQERIVIFIDEIDSTINLSFTDDFFSAIRACYNARATNDAYQRLTFVLLGVATPSQLIKDQTRTPFNVGHRIDLTDFSWEEAKPLAPGLGNDAPHSEALLQRVLEWTGGHPYLTQKLCHLLAQENGQKLTTGDVDRLVEQHFLSPESNKDEYNLKFVRDRLTGEPDKTREILQLYRSILKGNMIADNTLSPVHTTMKLSGLVAPQSDGTLMVRNKIYQQVFSLAWVKGALPRDRVKLAVASTAAACVLAFLVWYQIFLPRPYIQQLQEAKEDVPTEAFESLQNIPGFGGKADELLAQYWDRRAIRAASNGDRDRALTSKMQALLVHDIPQRRQEANALIGKDYEVLQATFRHNRSVYQAAFSPDGQFIVTASGDEARVWRADGTGAPVVLRGYNSWVVNHAAFSADGQFIVTASGDQARVWRADGTGEPVVLTGHTDRVNHAAFSPDGQFIVTASDDQTARVWRADGTGTLVVLMRHTGMVHEAAFSPDGQWVVTASQDHRARVWRADGTGTPVVLLRHIGGVHQAAFSPNGEFLVIATSGQGFSIFAVPTWKYVKLLGMDRVLGRNYYSISFDQNGDKLVIGGQSQEALLVDLSRRKLLGIFDQQNLFKKIGITSTFSTTTAISPDGTKVITGGEGAMAHSLGSTRRNASGRLRNFKMTIWDIKNEKIIKNFWFNKSINSFSFSSKGTRVVLGGETVWIAQTDGTGESVVLNGHGRDVSNVEFSSNDKLMLSGSYDGTVRVWDLKNREESTTVGAHGAGVLHATFSPEGKWVGTVSEDGRTQVGQAKGMGTPVVLMGHTDGVNYAAFSPDGQFIVTASLDHTARVWQVDGMGTPVVLTGHTDGVSQAAFSPDGQFIVTASNDQTARVWQADGMGTPLVLTGHTDGVSQAAFSPDGQFIVTASLDHTARVWRADGTGKSVGLSGHSYSVNYAAFSPDGQFIVTASDDQTARVWRADGTGEPVVVLTGHTDGVSQATFSPDGQWVVTASWDGTARVWRADGTGEPVVLSFMETVKDVSFNTEGSGLLVATGSCCTHLFSVRSKTDNQFLEIEPVSSRLLPFGLWSGAYRFLEDKSDQLQVGLLVTGNGIKTADIRFDMADAPPIEGDPKELLETWQRKLALKFDADGKIVPRWPVGERLPRVTTR